MKRILFRLLLFLAILQIAYLAFANLALNLPSTQSLINQHRPEKYAVHWERAWSWYPLRVHAQGVSFDGQTSSQQWRADVSAVSASVAVLPLLRKTVQLSGVKTRDVGFRIRPRPKPEKDYGKISAFFPPIRNRDPDSPATDRAAAKPGKGWKIVVDDIHAQGSHDLWIYQMRGALDGALRASLFFETRGGPFALGGGEVDIGLRSLTLNKDWEVSSGGTVKGKFGLAPFVPSANPGLKALGFLTLAADLDAPVDSLDFLDFYLRGLNDLEVDGKGRLQGHLKYDKGNLISGTELLIAADELALNASPYEVDGAGGIDILVDPKDPRTLRIAILFDALQALHQDDQIPLFTGEGLSVEAWGTSRVLPDEEREQGNARLAVSIPSVEVADLRAYQRYLPDKWGVTLGGGQGTLRGHAEYSPLAVNAELNLVSSDADLGVKDFRFVTNLDLGLKVSGGVSESVGVDLSGTYLLLDEARLASNRKGASKPWRASLAISEGTLGVPVPDGESGEPDFRRLSAVFKEQGVKALLATADADLDATLEVSDLGWINLLFKNPFDLAISGSGEIAAELGIREGWLAKGTRLRVQPRGLRVQVLDYLAQGKGDVALAVVQGGATPDMRLDAKLDGARLQRRGEEDAFVQGVKLEVSAVAKDMEIGGGKVAALDLRIPSARVKDMSIYNQYLPKDSPLELLGGEADLIADVHLEPKSAGGFVRLKTEGLRSRLDEQEVSGRLTLDIDIQGGVPAEMEFDISGSTLILDQFAVSGEKTSFDQTGWRTQFGLRKAQVLWKKPVRLDVDAEVEMTDSRPVVAMFANQRDKHGWLEKILTVREVKGNASLKVDGDRALVPSAMVGSDKIDVGAKGLVDPSGREGIFYARFRKLNGILKVKDGERNFDILRAKDTFDAYVPGETPLVLKGRQPGPAGTEPGSDEAPGVSSGTEPRMQAAPASRQDPLGNFDVE